MGEGSFHSYPSVFAFGHRALEHLFEDEELIVEEKIDGSQFSFGVIDGVLRARSKNRELILDAPEGMFIEAVETIRELEPALRPGWTYRAEYLQKPRHNVLAYDRIPNKHLIIFDISTGPETYIESWWDKAEEAKRLGLEVVPMFSKPENLEAFRLLLLNQSILGGQKIEGVVVKNYHRFGPDKHVLMGKFVSERFKEVAHDAWRKANPTSGDVVSEIIGMLRTPARWDKAVQHLRERGELEDSPRDIGKLFREVPEDIRKEYTDLICDKLFAYAWPHIQRGVTAGLAEYYKERLLAQQSFGTDKGGNAESGGSVAGELD